MKLEFVRAAIGLGGNLGDRAAHLDRALEEIAAIDSVHIVRRSSWYETDAVGGPAHQPRYLNGALWIDTRLRPAELLSALQAIERAHGRDRAREPRHGPRTLDLDLLLFGSESIDEPGLTVPHPRMEERTFVLAPLAEIAPGLLLPRSGKLVIERLKELEGQSSAAIDALFQRDPHRRLPAEGKR